MSTTRFAPSPTGRLHLGHIYSALFARRMGRMGRMKLRIEDIDHTRCRPAWVDAILADLQLVGISTTPDWYQSTRLDHYAAALKQLDKLGLIYPCFCTRSDLQQILRAPHHPAASYNGTCRRLGQAERAQAMHSGRAYSYRLHTAACRDMVGELEFTDLRLGSCTLDYPAIGDAVIARKDIHTSYHLACVVDDADQQISLVTRGEDLFTACHIQRLLQALLDLPTPAYCHHPLLTDGQGRLAKRRNSIGFAQLIADGQLSIDQLHNDFAGWFSQTMAGVADW